MSRNHRAVSNKRWARFRRSILDRDGWRCRRCGRAGRLEVHHVEPVESGGAMFDPDNCETLCRTCHMREHRAPSPERDEWRDFLRAGRSGSG